MLIKLLIFLLGIVIGGGVTMLSISLALISDRYEKENDEWDE